jgi:hypothetical protein
VQLLEQVLEHVLGEELEHVLGKELEQVLGKELEQVLGKELEQVLGEELEQVLEHVLGKELEQVLEQVSGKELEQVSGKELEQVLLEEGAVVDLLVEVLELLLGDWSVDLLEQALLVVIRLDLAPSPKWILMFQRYRFDPILPYRPQKQIRRQYQDHFHSYSIFHLRIHQRNQLYKGRVLRLCPNCIAYLSLGCFVRQ